MAVYGLRGDTIEDHTLSPEELEVYGVDWEGLLEDEILDSQRANHDQREAASSWVGRVGPPDELSEVVVDPPEGPDTDEARLLAEALSVTQDSADDHVLTMR